MSTYPSNYYLFDLPPILDNELMFSMDTTMISVEPWIIESRSKDCAFPIQSYS